MRYNIKASSLPLIVGIVLAVVSLSIPWMAANHYIEVGDRKEVADNYVFFMWGQQYTVRGTKLIQSVTDVYDYRDFPFYSMVFVIIAIALGLFTFLSGRGTILNVRGKVIKFKAGMNPLIPLGIASGLLLLSWWYIQTASQSIVQVLQMRQYVVEPGPSLDFLMLSFIAYAITMLMTGRKFIKKPTTPKALEASSTDSTAASNPSEQLEKTQTQSKSLAPLGAIEPVANQANAESLGVARRIESSANPFSLEFIETKLRIIDILSSYEAPKTVKELAESYYGNDAYTKSKDSSLRRILAEMARDGFLMETTKEEKVFEIKKGA